MNSNFKFGCNDPLNNLDSPTQTYGCRAFKPENCSRCMNDTCGLFNKTHICTTPPAGWAKRYNELKKISKKR